MCIMVKKIYVLIAHNIGEFSFLFNSIHNLVYMLIEYFYVSVWWLVWCTNDYINCVPISSSHLFNSMKYVSTCSLKTLKSGRSLKVIWYFLYNGTPPLFYLAYVCLHYHTDLKNIGPYCNLWAIFLWYHDECKVMLEACKEILNMLKIFSGAT